MSQPDLSGFHWQATADADNTPHSLTRGRGRASERRSRRACSGRSLIAPPSRVAASAQAFRRKSATWGKTRLRSSWTRLACRSASPRSTTRHEPARCLAFSLHISQMGRVAITVDSMPRTKCAVPTVASGSLRATRAPAGLAQPALHAVRKQADKVPSVLNRCARALSTAPECCAPQSKLGIFWKNTLTYRLPRPVTIGLGRTGTGPGGPGPGDNVFVKTSHSQPPHQLIFFNSN